MFSISPLQEFDILRACLLLILVGQSQHLVGHIEAVGFAAWADTTGGEQHVDTPAGAEIEHDLTRIQLSQCSWVAAAERGQHGVFGDFSGLDRVIEIRSNGVASGAIGPSCPAAGTAAGLHPQRCLAVFFFDHILNACVAHGITPIYKSERCLAA